MSAAIYHIYAVDKNGVRLGEIDNFANLKMRFVFNGVGAWTLDSTPKALAQVLVGGGISVQRNGDAFFSGLVTGIERDGAYALQLNGVDDNVHLRDRLALPDPAGPPFGTQAYDVRTGAAETVMHEYVYYNAGAGARSERQVSGLTLGSDFGRGKQVIGRARFDNLLLLLAALGDAGGVGFKITDGEFCVYEPEDKSGSVVLSFGLGSLRDYSYRFAAPKQTMIYAGGQGEGTARTIVLGEDSAARVRWGRRIEGFLDKRQTSDTNEIVEAIATALRRAGEQKRLALTPESLVQMQPVDDYWLGDTVTAVIDGEVVRERVREVVVTLDSVGGEVIEPVVGTVRAAALDVLMRLFDDSLAERIGALERV